MRCRYLALVLILGLFGQALGAATISGFVTRDTDGQPLEWVSVYVPELKTGAQTNKNGYFVVNLGKTGTYTLKASLVSYAQVSHTFTVSSVGEKISHNFTMERVGIQGNKVTVTANYDDLTKEIKVSSLRQTTEDLQSIVSVAESDVFRSLATLPGVTPISDFSSGLYVRGGSPDQNLILIDDTDVYNPSHFGGIFSTFSTDAIESAELIKGGYPARYGGRLSSVLDVSNRQGNRNDFAGTARLSMISSGATLEGPWHLGNQHGSIMGSFRRTYVEVLQQLVDEIPDYYFYDGHAKFNWDLGAKDKLAVGGYFGKDKLRFDFGDVLDLNWGNDTISAQWQHLFSPQLFSHFVLAGSKFESYFQQSSSDGENIYDRTNGISDLTSKGVLSWNPSSRHQVDTGFEVKYNDTWLRSHTSYSYDPASLPDIKVSSLTSALFAQDSWQFDAVWSLQTGLRLSWYQSLYQNLPSLPDASYLNLEPRISLRRKLDLNESVYASFGRFHQYLTLMSMNGGTPLDVWFPLDGSLDPGVSDHYILGYQKDYASGFGLDLEVYYKTYDKILEYNINTDYTWDNETGQLADTFHVGKGFTYGADFLLKTDWQGVQGFIAYTFSRTQRRMEGLNTDPLTGESQYFFPKYDRTHSFNLVQTYNLTENTGSHLFGGDLKFGTNISYSTGQPTDVPERIYFDGQNFQLIYSYSDRKRLPYYMRWDFSAKLEFFTRWGSIEPYLEVINLLGRKNIGGRSYYVSSNDAGEPELLTRDSAQFPRIPFLGINFKW